MKKYQSTKIIELGSAAFRQWASTHSHCQYLHGYNLTAKFWIESRELDHRNWVFDFGDFDEIKRQLRELIDHKTLVAANDPALQYYQVMEKQGIMQLTIMPNGVGIERTAELCYNIASEYIFKQIKAGKCNPGCMIVKVEVWEHDKNSAVFIPDNVYTA